ncbi:hypothetical protein AOXY_G25473 [Acipenser oxyrinchus oxyrinchus]|uniref:Uncharacterized protein n=1 Tax=Acipenser oxyrinchus oxyrinchus TaxID=40147 RepID=A0AAD8FT84_ACIOX|nr:hypothetical protein AOXY_G25473 [Acipenser oxyrinchus oxyrinchus]
MERGSLQHPGNQQQMMSLWCYSRSSKGRVRFPWSGLEKNRGNENHRKICTGKPGKQNAHMMPAKQQKKDFDKYMTD